MMRFAQTAETAEQEEAALWEAYKKPGKGASPERLAKAREALILRYLSLVNRIVALVSMGLPSIVRQEDLVSYGILGLLDAVDKFDPSRGNRFETYASKRIRGAILDGLRELDWVSRSVRVKLRKAQEGAIPREAVEHDLIQSSVSSLDELLAADDQGGVVHVFDLVADPSSPDPVATFEEKELKEILAKVIDELPERERLVMSLYYNDELGVREIAKVLGVSPSRVSQIHTRAVERIHARLVAVGYD